MTTNPTEAHETPTAAEPLALSLHDLLGQLPEAATTGTFPGPHGYSREQMRAYAAHELESLQDSCGQLMAENVRLRAALLMAVRQNEHDMVMTGDELRACHAALGPNARLTGPQRAAHRTTEGDDHG